MSRLSFLLSALGLSLGHHALAPLDRERPYLKPEERQTHHGRNGYPKPACQCCGVTLGRDWYCRNHMCEGYMLLNPKPRYYWPGDVKAEGEYYRSHGLRRPKMRPAKAHVPTYCRWCGHRISYKESAYGECVSCKRTPSSVLVSAAGGAR